MTGSPVSTANELGLAFMAEGDAACGARAAGPTFDAIYSAHCRDVLRWVRALGAREADVDDLTQETFLVVRDKLGRFDGRNVRGWLYRIARNVVSDHRRRAWFRRRVFRTEAELEQIPAADTHEVERRQALRLAESILNRLSAEHRAAFVLFEVEGYSADEIAALQQVPINTVYTRLHYARKRFLALVALATQEPTKGSL